MSRDSWTCRVDRLAIEQLKVAARQPFEEAPNLRLGHVRRPAGEELGHVRLVVARCARRRNSSVR